MSKDQKGTQTTPKEKATKSIEIAQKGKVTVGSETALKQKESADSDTNQTIPKQTLDIDMPSNSDLEQSTSSEATLKPDMSDNKKNGNKKGIKINEFKSDLEEDTEGEDKVMVDKDEEQSRKFLMMMADASSTDRYIQRVGYCDGNRPEKTLAWLRAIDRLPEDIRLNIALQTSESSLQSSVRELKDAKWPKVKNLLAKRYVNANFSEAQKEALDRLEQRPGESLYNYITTFEILLNEAYSALPEDQTTLIRTFLSGLSDREMAKRVAKKKIETLSAVVKETRLQYQDDDLLRPRRAGKVHYSEAVENPQMAALSSVVGDLAKTQKETSAQIAALVKAGTSSPKPKGVCFRCGKSGHFARECRTNNTGTNPAQRKFQVQSSQYTSMKRCDRCQRVGHIARDCWSGPPRTPCYYCNERHWVYDCKAKKQSTPQTILN